MDVTSAADTVKAEQPPLALCLVTKPKLQTKSPRSKDKAVLEQKPSHKSQETLSH